VLNKRRKRTVIRALPLYLGCALISIAHSNTHLPKKVVLTLRPQDEGRIGAVEVSKYLPGEEVQCQTLKTNHISL
jgi:hypothetical protein